MKRRFKEYQGWKVGPMEELFLLKYKPEAPQEEIPFTHAEAREVAQRHRDDMPANFNNFIKDLVRSGNPHPVSPSALKAGYSLRESTDQGVMGVWFKGDPKVVSISVSCPPDLIAQALRVSVDPLIWENVRDDEGGCLTIINRSGLLDVFFDVEPGSVHFIQSPVKLQPTEIDGIFVGELPEGTVLLPCEAKSRKGRDALNMNQVIGGAASALDNFMRDTYAGVIPLGAQILKNGDIYVVSFPFVTLEDRDNLKSLITPNSVIKQARYRLKPPPSSWSN